MTRPRADRQRQTCQRSEAFRQLGNRLLDHVDQNTVQRATTQSVESLPAWAGLYRVSPVQGPEGKVHEAIARDIPAWNERLWSKFWRPALKNTLENAASDLGLSGYN